jgi:PAS domain S-box-containing protein
MNKTIIKILIVEDDNNVAMMISMILKSLKYKVTGIVTSCKETIASVEKEKPDLILMDIMIEGNEDGIETAIIIKKKHDIPVVFLTAFSDNESIKRAKEAEPFGYLIKPFNTADLKVTVEMAFNKIEYELKIKKSELWFRSTLNSIGDGIIATDPINNIKFINAVAEDLLDVSYENVKNKKLEEVYTATQDMTPEGLVYLLSEKKENFKEAFKNNKILISKSGKKIPIEEKISSIKYDTDEIIGNVIIFKDVSLKREAQLKVLSVKDFYLNIFEKFPVLIWRANQNGQYNYFNNYWLEFRGKQIDAEIYNGWYSGIHPDDRQLFVDMFNEALCNKEKFEIEIRLIDKENNYRWLFCIASPIINIKGNFDGYIGLCLDITNRKILEEELKQSKLASENLSRAKSNFISNMSHEIRTPLNGIMGLTDLLLESKLDSEQFEFLLMVKQSARTLLNLLNNLLDYSKIEDKKEKYNESKFSLTSLIKEILTPYTEIEKKNGITVGIKVHELIPPVLIGDGRKIQQVLTNLISNAFKFTERAVLM